MRAVIVTALVLALGACDRADMESQERAKSWDRNPFFPKGMTMREPVAGTVARNDPATPAPQPATVSADLLQRGRERYAIHCTPCHGASGNGRGIIVGRGFPPAPSFAEERLRTASAAYHYAVITNGKGVMYGLSQQIPSSDRWAIVAYVRALALSQGAEVASLSPEDRAKLEAVR